MDFLEQEGQEGLDPDEDARDKAAHEHRGGQAAPQREGPRRQQRAHAREGRGGGRPRRGVDPRGQAARIRARADLQGRHGRSRAGRRQEDAPRPRERPGAVGPRDPPRACDHDREGGRQERRDGSEDQPP